MPDWKPSGKLPIWETHSHSKRGITGQQTNCTWEGKYGPVGNHLFYMHGAKKYKTQSLDELEMCRLHKNFCELLKPSFDSFSEEDSNFLLEMNDFPYDANTTILNHEGARFSMLESAFRRQTERIVSESSHTLSLLPTSKPTLACSASATLRTHPQRTKYTVVIQFTEHGLQSGQSERSNSNWWNNRLCSQVHRRSTVWSPLT